HARCIWTTAPERPNLPPYSECRLFARRRGTSSDRSSSLIIVYRSKLPGRLLAAATLLFTLACSDRTAEPRLLVYGSPDAADRSMVSVLAEAAAERGLELRMTTDPAAVVEDSLEAYRGVLLLNTSADSLPR